MNARKLLIGSLPVCLALGALLAGCQRAEPDLKTELVRVSVSKPLPRDIRDWGTFVGQVKSKENVEVKAQVTGTVTAVKFAEGTEVKEDAVLFEIDRSTYAAVLKQTEGQLQRHNAEKETAEKDVVRLKKLVDKGAAAQAEYDEAVGRRAKAAAAILAAEGDVEQAKVNLNFCTIKAPISGQVGKALVTKGNLIHEAGVTVMTTIVQMDPIYAEFGVDERALLLYKEMKAKQANGNKISTARDAKVPVELGLSVEKGQFPHKGIIEFVDNKVDPSTGTVLIRAEFANSDRKLVPGLFATVRIAVSDPYPALLVSDRALLTDQSVKYVLIAVKEEGGKYRVKRKDVEVGGLEDNLRIIKAGIEPHDWIIVNGVQYARPETLVEVSEEDMPGAPGKKAK